MQLTEVPPIAQVMGTQYYDTGWFTILITLMVASFVLINIFRAKGGKKDLFIRRIAGLNAIDEAIGRATEMGRPVLMVPGLGELNAISVQALNIFAYITRTAAKFANPIRLCCGNAAVYTVATEVIRDVYQNEGVPERFDPDAVRFMSDRQFAFAASVSGTILREQTAACFFMGEFFAESMIFAETANSIGAIQVASSTEITQTPFFIAACDYVLIGEEFYAASAYLTRQPVLVGSVIGQDWGKLLVLILVTTGIVTSSIQRSTQTSYMRDVSTGDWVPMDATGASRIKVEGNWVDVRNVYPQGQPPAKEANISGSWVPITITPEAPGADGKPTHKYTATYSGKTVAVEEASRQMIRPETWLGKYGAPGKPKPLETPREKYPEENKEGGN